MARRVARILPFHPAAPFTGAPPSRTTATEPCLSSLLKFCLVAGSEPIHAVKCRQSGMWNTDVAATE